MKQKLLYPLWGFAYILCLGLGLIPERSAAGGVVLTVLSVLFFLPGALLLRKAILDGDKKGLVRLRWISILSLSLTFLALLGNLFSLYSSTTLGDVMHAILCIVSVPMLCSDLWLLPLFLWACLLFATFYKPKQE